MRLGPCRPQLWITAGLAIASLAVSVAQAEERAIDLATDTDVYRIDSRLDWDLLGWGMASCDVNGDGISDYLVTDRDTNAGGTRTSAGEVYLFFGRRQRWTGPGQLPGVADVVIYGQDVYDGLGDGIGCGEINGDGFDDIIVGASASDGPGNSRSGAGQAHLIFGADHLPPVIDLATASYPIVYGQGLRLSGDFNDFCEVPAVADINGDGLGDLILDDMAAPDLRGEHHKAGRLYVLFGRESWPAEIDLLPDGGDLTLYGADKWDLIEAVGGDIDSDGTDDLIVSARGGDGPGETRGGVGDCYVFHGRATWPIEIDLTVDQGDSFIHGADDFDQIRTRALTDIDADGSEDLLFASLFGDGPTNEDNKKGEVRLYAPGGTPWPELVDLATSTETIVYGRGAGDRFGAESQTGDVNGDGFADLVVSAYYGDGPDDLLRDSGEIFIIAGGATLPEVTDLAIDEGEVVIYGAVEFDMMRARALSDINGDGLKEIAIRHASANYQTGHVWVVSPYDVDGDGITQLPDNCPLVYNPAQVDENADLRGDLCSTDWDGDGLPDDEDCAIASAAGGTPEQVVGLSFESGSTTTLTWQTAAFADLYDLARGDLSTLDGSDYGACQNSQDPDLSDTTFEDPDEPGPGEGYHYLVRGHNQTCRLGGSWGTTSSGADRLNTALDPCL